MSDTISSSVDPRVTVAAPDVYDSDALPAGPCRNCDHLVTGRFCSHCGQEHTTGLVPLREFVRDIADELFDFDSKAMRSLKPLIARPGFLTAEYVAGRRRRYMLPSRMYIVLSLLFFILVTSFDPVGDGLGVWSQGELQELASQHRMSVDSFVEQMNAKTNDILPTILLVGIIPSFALLMKVFYIGSRALYVQHLIFSFHFFSFVLVALTPVVVFGGGDVVAWILFAGLYVYLLAALQRVYRQGWFLSAVKAALLWIGFILLLYISFAIAPIVAAYRV